MSKDNSKGKEAVPENEETSKDWVFMKEAMDSAEELIKHGTPTQGTKKRRGICMGSTRNDCESSKNIGGVENGGSSTVSKIVTVATVATVAVVAVCLVGGFICLLSGLGSDPDPEEKRKTMVAPGRSPNRISRDDFTNDPRGYFRGLHADDKMKKKLNGKK